MASFANTVSDLIKFTEEGIRVLVGKYQIESECGYLAVYNCLSNIGFLLICQIGVNPIDKREKRLALCQEKARRLALNHKHNSSFQSRNPEEARFAGAIRAGTLILSFSGLPELDDEALMAYVAYRARLLTKNEALEIGVISKNNHLCEII